jgi:diaminopropionate ammonia-lyase
VRLTALVNPAVREDAVPEPSQAAAAFHASLAGFQPTPVRELPAVAHELALGAVLVKDESRRLGLPAFKVLGASWAIELALREQPGTHTLVAASNHGRAVAHVAARRGLGCRVFLPARSLPRRGAIAAEGAELIVVDGSYEDAVAQAEAAGLDAGTVVIADVGAAGPARWVIDGYATLFAETATQAGYDLIVVPVGVGSLAAAAARHAAQASVKVIGVEPVTAACLTASLAAGRPTRVSPGTTMAGLDCAEVSPAAWPSLYAGVHGTLTVDDRQVRDAVHELAAAGLTIGESGAAPLAALRALVTDPACSALEQATLGRSSRVLLIATEGPTAGAPDARRRCP